MFTSTNRRQFSAEASTLGWEVGRYRTHIDFDDERFFYVDHVYNNQGELVGWTYRSCTDRIITVFND